MITRALIYIGGQHAASVSGQLFNEYPEADDCGRAIDNARRALEEAFSTISECEEVEVAFPELGETYDDREETRWTMK